MELTMREPFFQVLCNKDLLKYIVSFQDGRKWHTIHDGNWAARNNHLNLLNTKKDLLFNSNVIDEVAAKGHLHIIKWLYKNKRHHCTTKAMDNAATYGHYEVLLWLHKKGKKCTTNAMDGAAAHGYFPIVLWLHQNGNVCTHKAIDRSGANGHYEIFLWLLKNTKHGCDINRLRRMPSTLDTPSLKLVLENFTFPEEKKVVIDSFVESLLLDGNLPKVQWFVENYNVCIKLPIFVFSYGYFPLIKWVYEREPFAITKLMMIHSLQSLSLELVQWLYFIDPSILELREDLEFACVHCNVPVAKWILSLKNDLIDDNLIITTIQSNCLFLAEWLISTKYDSITLENYLALHPSIRQNLQMYCTYEYDFLRQCERLGITLDYLTILKQNIRWNGIAIVEYIHSRDETLIDNPSISLNKLMYHCVANDYLEMIQFVHKLNKLEKKDALLNRAIVGGYFGIVQWLFSIGITCYSKRALLKATKLGYLDLVYWLRNNKT